MCIFYFFEKPFLFLFMNSLYCPVCQVLPTKSHVFTCCGALTCDEHDTCPSCKQVNKTMPTHPFLVNIINQYRFTLFLEQSRPVDIQHVLKHQLPVYLAKRLKRYANHRRLPLPVRNKKDQLYNQNMMIRLCAHNTIQKD